MAKKNPRLGSMLESVLREDSSYEDVENQAIKAVLAHKPEEAIKAQNLSKAVVVNRDF